MSNNFFLVKKETSQKRQRPGAGLLLILVLLILSMLAFFFILVLPAFKISEMHIEGNVHLKAEEIFAASQIEYGSNLFIYVGGGLSQILSLRYGAIEDELTERFPSIKTVTVQASIPSRINIVIEERYKIGYLAVPDGYAAIDMDGVVIEISASDAPKNVPLIEGLPIKTAVLGKKLSLSEEEGMNRCLIVLGAILDADYMNSDGSGYDLMSCIKEIRYVGNNTLFLTLRPMKSSKNILVKIGSLSHIQEDMIWLRQAFASDMIDYSEPKVLDLSVDAYTLRKNE